jgi:hypothetical protein
MNVMVKILKVLTDTLQLTNSLIIQDVIGEKYQKILEKKDKNL